MLCEAAIMKWFPALFGTITPAVVGNDNKQAVSFFFLSAQHNAGPQLTSINRYIGGG